MEVVITELFVYSLAHLLVDGLCAATIFGGTGDGEIIFLYNTLAFSTQAITGAVADKLRHCHLLTALACAVVVLGFLLPLPEILKIILVGLGNSLFHVGGGSVALEKSGNKAWPLGVFVSPGAIGLTLGTLFPQLGWIFMALLLVCAAVIAFKKFKVREAAPASAPEISPGWALVCALALLVAVAVRSYGGFAVSFPWKTGAGLTITMTLFVFGGKFLGGFVCDRLGAGKTALISLPLAAALVAFGSNWIAPSLLGQLLLNLTMPVTLLLIYRILPEHPAFGFGLAASVLWPGAIAASYIKLSGPALASCIILAFLFGLAAIIVTDKKLCKRRNEK